MEYINTQLRTVNYFGKSIEYYLTFKKVKNINLRLRNSDGTIQVSASPRVRTEFIDSFVISNGEFVLNALEHYKREAAKTERFTENQLNDGDEVLILGKAYKVKIEKTKLGAVEIKDGYIILKLWDIQSEDERKKVFESWLQELRMDIYYKIIYKLFPAFEEQGKLLPKLIIKDSVSKWGYCQPQKNTVMMNKQLICVPMPLIEYLALHELTHLIFANHSQNFWRFMEKNMPDCKIRRKQLQSYSFLLKK